MSETQDMTLDEIRAALAPALARHAAFDGWRPPAVAMAARESGIDPDIAQLAFAGGAIDMIDAWFASVDAAMLDMVPPETTETLSIRGRIVALIEARMTIMAPDRDALRRALATLAMPVHAARAARLAWRASDVMWRAAGDTATDLNHYSKRMTLTAIYGATILAFIDDESEGQADSRAFLARRIEGLMRFEKMKARIKGAGGGERLSLSRFIGRLRYRAT